MYHLFLLLSLKQGLQHGFIAFFYYQVEMLKLIRDQSATLTLTTDFRFAIGF